MRLSSLALAVTMATVGACGDDGDAGTDGSGTTEDTTGTSDSTGATASGTGTSTTDSGGQTGSTGAAESSSGATGSGTTSAESSTGDSGSSDSGSSTGSGMASLDAAISDLALFQDCMPIVAPDPLGVTFNLALTNTGDSPATASVVSAVILDGGAAQVGSFEVMPTDFGPIPAGDSSMDVVTKTADSLMPADGCGVAMCNQTYTVELTLDVDGAHAVASAMGPVSCVF